MTVVRAIDAGLAFRLRGLHRHTPTVRGRGRVVLAALPRGLPISQAMRHTPVETWNET